MTLKLEGKFMKLGTRQPLALAQGEHDKTYMNFVKYIK